MLFRARNICRPARRQGGRRKYPGPGGSVLCFPQRQHFRGVRWFVLQDPAGVRFFRLSEAAYHFTAMLDGRRTVAEVWRISN